MTEYLEYEMSPGEEAGFKSKGRKLEYLAGIGFDIGRHIEVRTGNSCRSFPKTLYRQEIIEVEPVIDLIEEVAVDEVIEVKEEKIPFLRKAYRKVRGR